jgi:hypothetical protein
MFYYWMGVLALLGCIRGSRGLPAPGPAYVFLGPAHRKRARGVDRDGALWVSQIPNICFQFHVFISPRGWKWRVGEDMMDRISHIASDNNKTRREEDFSLLFTLMV